MNIFIWILFAIILYVFISYYYRFPENVKIINAYEKSFNNTLLFEKQPIVLLDNPYPSLQIAKSYIVPYTLTKNIEHIPLIWNKNPAKYLFITSVIDTEIHLLPASKKLYNNQPLPDDTLITLQIKPTHIVILPFHWHYYSSHDLIVLGMNDYISWLL